MLRVIDLYFLKWLIALFLESILPDIEADFVVGVIEVFWHGYLAVFVRPKNEFSVFFLGTTDAPDDDLFFS